MLVLMLETRRGSPDGHVVNVYPKGAEVRIPQSLAASFIGRGWAKSMESFDFNTWLDGFLMEIRKDCL